MSTASNPANASAETRTERLQHWIAVRSSALLHVLFLLLALWSSQLPVTTSEGAEAGSRTAVSFVGRTPPPVSAPASKPVARPAASRLQSTLVERAEDPVPPIVLDAIAQDHAESSTETSPAAPVPPAPSRPRSQAWGQPPGLLPQGNAAENAGQSRSTALAHGRGNASGNAGPSMEVDGYQVYYDLRSENRLRSWREQGMTELFLPLPGTRRLMVCPLETALRRESGPCRLVEPDSPELVAIGDAREAINMQRVYKLGEVVWRGPGPYR